ncbi:MAG: class D sortase [Anaerolineae bacterium]|nr:class D sortase [Anaerolineae bacterium]
MRDRRSVDDLTIEELEHILHVRKHQARQQRLQRFASAGRRRADLPSPEDAPLEELAESPEQQTDETVKPVSDNGKSWRERSLRDKLLLAVELIAVLGLVGLMILTAQTLQRINQEAAAAQASNLANLPTPTATPLIGPVVLPGGHTSPLDPGGSKPNYDEVPAHLRPIIEQQLNPVWIPTPAPSSAHRIRIPVIRVDAPVVQGDGDAQLMQGVGQHIGTANPGQPGNVVLTAHNDIHGEIFRDLELLKEGDEIILETLTQTFIYQVVLQDIVEPTDVKYLESTNEAITTLISCYPYWKDTHRIVIIAGLVEP